MEKTMIYAEPDFAKEVANRLLLHATTLGCLFCTHLLHLTSLELKLYKSLP